VGVGNPFTLEPLAGGLQFSVNDGDFRKTSVTPGFGDFTLLGLAAAFLNPP
jgi:hypothetical protein